MKRRLQSLLLAFLLAGTTTVASAAPALWEVSDADSKVWLFGSIHVLRPQTQWRTSLFDETLSHADQVYFEADIGPLGQIGLIIQGLKMALSPPKPWAGKLSAEQTSEVTEALKPLGLTLPQLLNYEPWLAEAMIEEAVVEKHGYSASLGVDSTLQAELPKERKAYFETATEQMGMLAADTQDRQIARLMATVGSLDQVPGQLDAMAKSWIDGSGDELASQIAADPAMDETLVQTLLRDRNAKWVTSIEALLAADHQDLIVVGAAHLSGEGSVIDLLGKAGFTVRRVQ